MAYIAERAYLSAWPPNLNLTYLICRPQKQAIGPKQWQNNQAPNKYKFHFYIRARIMMIRCQNHMELSDTSLEIQFTF